MKNADKPVYPIVGSEGFPTNAGNINESSAAGLTKREYIAIQIASGMTYEYSSGNWTKEDVAENAITITDELLKQLEK